MWELAQRERKIKKDNTKLTPLPVVASSTLPAKGIRVSTLLLVIDLFMLV